ncbi:tetratricopeptide repeat protein [Maricaulis salignorans]|uniref:tetratricopeptide repeat protein n=1 Tax=Maricaulis salignorans TaxID=144026 RepID=UPI003A8F3DFB
MRVFLSACLLTLAISAAHAQTPAIEIETARYLDCLERVEREQDQAFEDALAWRMEGGGWPAAHCEALALIALGDTTGGALSLEELAGTTDGGRGPVIRSAMLVDAGKAWLTIGRSEDAQRAFAAALELNPDDQDALLGQASAALALGDWPLAGDAATAVIGQAPDLAAAWRLRAAARLETGALDDAWQDMEMAREIAPDNIEILVLRGRINEARRLVAPGED